MLAMLAHEVVDSLPKQGLDVGIGVERELVQSAADGRAEIANHCLLPLTWISGLRGQLGDPGF